MTRKASKRSSDENLEQNLANYLKRKSLLHQQILLQQSLPPQDRPSFWTSISNQIWNLVSKTFKKEARLNPEDLFNEACAARLAAQRNSYRIRSRRELDFLCRKTKFTRSEIKLLYLGWKDVCVNGYLNETTCKEIYAQFFPQASDSSLYAKHIYRALFSRNNILTNLNNNNILVTNANSNFSDQLNDKLTEEDKFELKTPSPVPSKQFRQLNKRFINQESIDQTDYHQNRSRLRSQSTTGFRSSATSATSNIQITSSNTPGLLSKRRTQSLAKQTLDSSPNYLDNLGKTSNSNLSTIKDDEVYFDYPLKKSSRNASSANLSSYRDTLPDKISFVEYAISLSALLKGSVEEKLAWTFQLYDVSGDGKLTVDELIEISKAVYSLLGYYVAPPHDATTWVEHGKQVFEKIDKKKTGCVSLADFIDCCLKDESIIKSLQLITAHPF